MGNKKSYRPPNHGQLRAMQRYNARPTAMEFEDMRSQIVRGVAPMVEDQILKAIYEVELRGRKARVVYSPLARKILTFLPPKDFWVK